MRNRWFLLAALSATYLLEQGTRQIYNATLPQIRLDFLRYGVTDVQLGIVGTVFGAVFGVAVLFAGLAADFLGRERVVVAGTLVFSLGVLLSGFSGGLWSMVAFYGVMNALGQSCVAPPCFSIISEHFENERCLAMGIFSASNYVGVIVCSVLSGVLGGLGAGGWRWAFWAFGAFGAVWALALGIKAKNTVAKPSASNIQPDSRVRDAFAAFGKKPTAILLAIAFGMFIYTNLGIYLWAPTFMMRSFEGISLASAAFHAVLWSSAGSMLSLLVAAKITDRLAIRRPMARFEVTIVGMGLCILTVFGVATASRLPLACLSLFAFGLARGVLECTVYPAMFDVIVPRFRSACTGMVGCWAFLFGSLAPTVLGWLSQHFTLRLGIASLAAFDLVGMLLLLIARCRFLRRDIERSENEMHIVYR